MRITRDQLTQRGWERALKLSLYLRPNVCVCEQFDCPHRGQRREHVSAGRCRSGKRWFWVAQTYSHDDGQWHGDLGRADTEWEAVNAIAAALLARDDDVVVSFSAGNASHRLRTLNKEARAERIAAKPPSDDTDAVHSKSLYTLHHRCWDTCQDPDDPYGRSPDHQCYQVLSYPITKTTATRFYFTDGHGSNYYISRSAFDTDGRAYHAKVRETLNLNPPELRARRRHVPAQRTESLTELRKAMADAHPDRGGDRDSFQAARRAYLAAKQVAK